MSLPKLRFALDSVRSMAAAGQDLENEALQGLSAILEDSYEELRLEQFRLASMVSAQMSQTFNGVAP